MRALCTILCLAVALLGAARIPSLDFQGEDCSEMRNIERRSHLTFINRSDSIAAQIFEFTIDGNRNKDLNLTLLSTADTLSLTLGAPKETFGADLGRRSMQLTANRSGQPILDTALADTDGAYSCLRVVVEPDSIALWGGDGKLLFAGGIPSRGFYTTAEISASGKSRLIRSLVGWEPLRPACITPYTTTEAITAAAEPDDSGLCGIWQYLDEDVDTTYALRGGNYRFGIMPRNDGSYAIIYLDGAHINSARWQPGTLKGALTPSGLESNYNLEWIDSEGNTLSDGTYASIDGNLLTLEFPYQHATLRFIRRP